MKPPTSVFQLGRMRHVDLLALWFQLHPSASHGRGHEDARIAAMATSQLAAAILNGAPT